MGEIITLQFGNFANYVGTHYWNIQERNYSYCDTNAIEHEIESNLLWRGDEQLNGTLKYTPRVIIVDLKDSKGGLSKEGCIVREKQPPQITTWNSNTATFAAETKASQTVDFTELLQTNPEEPPPSPQIENWSDFLALDFNPNSIFECSEYKFGIHAFDKYSDGQSFLQNPQEVEDLEDKVRKFLEGADSPQGFQIFANTYDGFGAVAAGILEKINDEFAKPSLTFGVSPSHFDPQGDDIHHMINTALSLTELSKASTVYAPVVMDWSFFSQRLKTHKERSFYHSSAVIAASIDAATLNFRTFARTMDFNQMFGLLAPIREWNISSLLSSFPFEVPASVFSDGAPPFDLHPFIPLYTTDKIMGQTLGCRGIPKALSIATARQILEKSFHLPARSNCVALSQPFDAPKTFPCLLSQKPFFPKSVVGQLQTTKAIYPYLSCLSQSVSKLKLVAHNYPEIDFTEAYESLFSIAEGYANSSE